MAQMSYYPDKHHPCFFLVDALQALGADAEFVKDGRTLNCWGMKVNGRIVVYLIDNRHPHEAAHEDPAAAQLLQDGALVMHAQKRDAERVGGKWLPLAVSPGYRTPDKPVDKLYQVGFAGYVRDPERLDVLRHCIRHFTVSAQSGVFGDDAVSVYWQAQVGLNVSMGWPNPTSYDLNMRFWEIMATGTPLVTNYLPEMQELGIEPGTHCMTYQSADELISAIQHLLDNPSKAREMGLIAAKEVSEKHTYENRAKTVLEWLGD